MRRSFKTWTLLKRLKSALASNVVQTHQEISMTIIARTSPTGSLAHNSLLNSSASRPKAERNATVLWDNDVRPADLVTITNVSRLTPRAVANTVDCIGSQGFRTRGHCEGGFGDTCPIIEKTSGTVSEGIGVREIGWVAHDFCCRILRFGPVLPKQQKACHDAPDRCDDGEITGELGRGSNMFSRINTWYGQECHVGIE